MSLSFYFTNGEITHEDVLNLNNANAGAFLRMLGFEEVANTPWEVDPIPIQEVKEAVLVAEGLFDVNASSHARESISERNFHSFGLTEDMLKVRLELFKSYLLAAEERGMVELFVV